MVQAQAIDEQAAYRHACHQAGSFTVCKSVLANTKTLCATPGFAISHDFAVSVYQALGWKLYITHQVESFA
ncbi:hypothetical protein H744_1c0133 [Photobacterium gaetbulicola Gung47]|uniref:Uncharacterized protein n=1 Tax=Photobacterium gaetbulicola Gung47 TaxID=658445 RepID=A0A0C5WG39_9GAMM|nr:hypothetical protein H744_1c0133 [Photobacterium gaetbulicola Gung47]